MYHIPGPDNIAADAFSRLMDPSDQATALPLTRSQATNEMDPSAEARATTESQPTDNTKMNPLNKEQYDHIERFHNS